VGLKISMLMEGQGSQGMALSKTQNACGVLKSSTAY